jgi:hypothetical protein
MVAPTTASSNFAGSSNLASSTADTFSEQQPQLVEQQQQSETFEQAVVQTPTLFRDFRTGEIVELEAIGRAIG